MFAVGQQVICVDDTHVRKHLRKGDIYTIERIYEIYVSLVGIAVDSPLRGFYPHRFRPLIERKTDISIFKKLLNPANHRHLEGV